MTDRSTGSAAARSHAPLVRDRELRPSLRQAVGRGLLVVVANALALVVLDRLVPGFSVDRWRDAVLAGAALGLVNAMVWPALAFLVVPLSVLTLGIGAIVLNAALVGVLLAELPGVAIAGFGTALVVAVGITLVTTLVGAALAVDDDAWFDERSARRARRRAKRDPGRADAPPGVVFVQIDGLSAPVLRRALAAGDAPALHRWLHTGTHRVIEWRTEWSSQTGVSQCGILHGSVVDMPAFRWLEKETGAVVVSNHPGSAAAIEARHADGAGLLAPHGSSYGNLFSGDAARAVMTMSGAGRVKEGRIGAGYGRYFARPGNTVRTLARMVVEIVRERRAAADQRRRDVEPRVARSWTYALLRAFTTVVSRDVCINGVLSDMAEGRAAIYVNLLGYDEVSHHSGPARSDTLAVLRDIDRQIARIDRAERWTARPYVLMVLSDHGQTQGATFRQAHGEGLDELVARLTGAAPAVDPDSAAGRTESSAWLRGARGDDTPDLEPRATATAGDGAGVGAGVGADDGAGDGSDEGEVIVLASGSLGLVYLPGPPRRLTLEEIDERYPGLVAGLRSHPGVGFVLVRSATRGAMVLGATGHRVLAPVDAGDTGEGDVVTGDDPLAVFGPGAADRVRRVDGYTNVADLMVNARYDPDNDEIPAFEEQVASHGGMGGDQERPFVLAPVGLAPPAGPLDGPVAVHRMLKRWLAELGHPVDDGRPLDAEGAR